MIHESVKFSNPSCPKSCSSTQISKMVEITRLMADSWLVSHVAQVPRSLLKTPPVLLHLLVWRCLEVKFHVDMFWEDMGCDAGCNMNSFSLIWMHLDSIWMKLRGSINGGTPKSINFSKILPPRPSILGYLYPNHPTPGSTGSPTSLSARKAMRQPHLVTSGTQNHQALEGFTELENKQQTQIKYKSTPLKPYMNIFIGINICVHMYIYILIYIYLYI